MSSFPTIDFHDPGYEPRLPPTRGGPRDRHAGEPRHEVAQEGGLHQGDVPQPARRRLAQKALLPRHRRGEDGGTGWPLDLDILQRGVAG